MKPGIKLIALLVSGILLLGMGSPEQAVVGAAAVGLVWAVTRVRPRALWLTLRPLVPVIVLSILITGWLDSIFAAGLIAARLGLTLIIAALYTLTTPVTETIDVVSALARRVVGSRRADLFGLAVGLMVRFLPVMGQLLDEAHQARRARGLDWSLRALVVPTVVRAVKSADDVAMALRARGAED